MRSAKLFVLGLYVHLALSVVTPIGILYLGWGEGWNDANARLAVFYLVMVFAVQALGWVSAAMAALAYRKGRTERLLAAWRTLKFGTVPFYALNFLWSVLVWGAFTAASRGVFLLLVPIPVFITCLSVVQSGVTGWLSIRSLREEGRELSVVHSVLQFLPVLDVLDTLVLLRYGKPSTEV